MKIILMPKYSVGLKVITKRPATARITPINSIILNFSFKNTVPKKNIYKKPISTTKSVLIGPIVFTE